MLNYNVNKAFKFDKIDINSYRKKNIYKKKKKLYRYYDEIS